MSSSLTLFTRAKYYMKTKIQASKAEMTRLLSDDDVEDPGPGAACACSPTRFTIATLMGLVVFLTTALFFLVQYPTSANAPSCRDAPHGMEVLKPAGPHDTFLGLISDIHLYSAPGQCKDGGLYGRHGCDTPVALANTTLQDLAHKLAPAPRQVVLLMGDAAQHQAADSWDYKVTLSAMRQVFGLFRDTLPGTSVLPTLGNNDLPVHNGLPEVGWYSSVLKVYQPAVTRDPRVAVCRDFKESFLVGGYYCVRFDDEFHVISLNTNLFSADVPDKSAQMSQAKVQLAWLDERLSGMEDKVIIIGHHPPSISLYHLYHKQAAMAKWRLELFETYRTIYQKHSSKIISTFYGHEHMDVVQVGRSNGDEMGHFVVPSVSPVYSGQPSYGVGVIRTKDSETKLQDIFTFYTWLDYYNTLKSVPQFYTYQSFGSIFDVETLDYSKIYNKTLNIISESDKMVSFSSLISKVYQRRFLPPLPPHLFYCYTTNLTVASFVQCIEHFGYNGKPYIVNS